MMGFSLEQAKSNFFDNPAVMKYVDAKTRNRLSKFGAFVQRRAKSSIRKRKRASEPGDPPSSHRGLLKDWILFDYDPAKRSVVIGPMKLNQISFDASGQPSAGTVPATLEYGGTVNIFEVHKQGKWKRADLRSRRRIAALPQRMRKAMYKARPYMRPAYDIELQKLPALWGDSLAA